MTTLELDGLCTVHQLVSIWQSYLLWTSMSWLFFFSTSPRDPLLPLPLQSIMKLQEENLGKVGGREEERSRNEKKFLPLPDSLLPPSFLLQLQFLLFFHFRDLSFFVLAWEWRQFLAPLKCKMSLFRDEKKKKSIIYISLLKEKGWKFAKLGEATSEMQISRTLLFLDKSKRGGSECECVWPLFWLFFKHPTVDGVGVGVVGRGGGERGGKKGGIGGRWGVNLIYTSCSPKFSLPKSGKFCTKKLPPFSSFFRLKKKTKILSHPPITSSISF